VSPERWKYSLPEPAPEKRLELVLYLYCDESGKPDRDYVSACGYTVDQGNIDKFSKAWNRCTEQEYRVPPIHMREISFPSEKNGWAQIKARWGEDWNDNLDKMLKALGALVRPHSVFPVGTVVDVAAFRGSRYSTDDDVNYFAFRRLVSLAMEYVGEGDPGIGIVVDDDYESSIKYHGWIQKIRKRSQDTLGRSVKSLCFVDDKGYPLIQAADMLAYFPRDRWVKAKDNPGTPPSSLYCDPTKSRHYNIELLDAVKIEELETR
jgi:hypothetical protein